MKNKLFLIISTLFLVAIDVVTKYLFYTQQRGEWSIRITPSFNTGVSWSLPVPYGIVISISLLGILLFLWLWRQKQLSRRLTAILLGGTIGNVIDRIVYHGVRDFIDIPRINFPIFNGADIFLSIGVVIRCMTVILEKKK